MHSCSCQGVIKAPSCVRLVGGGITLTPTLSLRERGYVGSGAVEGRDDLLFNALDGFGIAERGEYDLLDTGVGELPD